MLLHVPRLSESLITLWTLERLLIRMHFDVVPQATERQELFTANFALKLLFRFAVNLLVAAQITWSLELLLAFTATVGFRIVVNLQVAAQVSCTVERLLALVTGPLSLSRMRQHVIAKDVGAHKFLDTDRTLIRPATAMRLLVRVEAGTAGQDLPALGTLVLGFQLGQRLLGFPPLSLFICFPGGFLSRW